MIKVKNYIYNFQWVIQSLHHFLTEKTDKSIVLSDMYNILIHIFREMFKLYI